MQSSDHHRLGDCGKRVTYANMADLSFASLEKCFINPSANISPTAKPEIRSIISQIAQDRDTIIVESVDYEYILAAASALLNNNYGYLLLGVAQNRYKNIKGVEPKEGLAKDIIDLVKSSLSPEKIYYSIESAEYKWGERSVFVFAFTNISNHSFTYHDKHYHIENNAPVESTTTYLLSSKHKRDIILESFNENHYNKLNLLTEELQIISEQRYALKTIEYIEEDGITLSNIFDIELVKPVDCDDVETDVQFGNSSGKVYVVDMESVQKIRGEDYYVRCTGIRDNKFAFSSENKYSGKAILLTPRGATYLIMEDEFNIVNLLGCHVVLLRVSEEFSFISIFSVLAWLKSSAFLWYVETLFGDSDIFKADIFRKLRIPASLLDSGIAHKLESSILNIMEIERAFLRQQEEMSDSLDGHLDNEYLTKSAQIHNKKVDPIASEIDDIINTTIGIDTDTLVYLYNFLKLSDYHSLGW